MRTAEIVVTGRVQKVGYRTRVMGVADAFNVTGYVRNLPDTRVEITAQADDDILKKFIEKIEIHDEMIDVYGVKVDYSENFKGFKGFHKIVGVDETDSRLDKAVDELKNVVAAIKEVNSSVQTLRDEVRAGNEEINENIKNMHYDLKEEIRKGNETSTKEIRDDVKAIKVHLKIP